MDVIMISVFVLFVQKSLDSGQGSSEIEPETLFGPSTFPVTNQEQYIFYDFEIPQVSLVHHFLTILYYPQPLNSILFSLINILM